MGRRGATVEGVTSEPDPDDDHLDPRLEEQPEGSDEGMPAEVIDTDHNLPGQQGPPPPVSDEEREG